MGPTCLLLVIKAQLFALDNVSKSKEAKFGKVGILQKIYNTVGI